MELGGGKGSPQALTTGARYRLHGAPKHEQESQEAERGRPWQTLAFYSPAHYLLGPQHPAGETNTHTHTHTHTQTFIHTLTFPFTQTHSQTCTAIPIHMHYTTYTPPRHRHT